MNGSVDSNQTVHSETSGLGLHCLLRPVCPNTQGKYGTRTGVKNAGNLVCFDCVLFLPLVFDISAPYYTCFKI